MEIKLTQEDLLFLENDYPSLKYDSVKNVIYGILYFDLLYPNVESIRIQDEYQFEIDLNQLIENVLPIVRETGGRIKNIATDKSLKLIDLHINENNELCIIIPPKIKEKYPNGFCLRTLIGHLQEHFYWISYFEKFGRGPWPAYSHGDLGYWDLYDEDPKKYTEFLRRKFNYSRTGFREILRKRNKTKLK